MTAIFDVQIWVDGSAIPNPGKGGWAALLISPLIGKARVIGGFAPKATNNQMEVTALIRGLTILKKYGTIVEVHTDSQYILQCVEKLSNQGVPNSNQFLWQHYRQVAGRHDIRFVKEKGHVSDNKLHNIVDEYARKCAKNGEDMDFYVDLETLWQW